MPDAAEDGCDHAGLEALRHGIPAARSLPLLQALAAPGAAERVVEAAPGLSMRLTLSAQDAAG